MLPAPKWIAPLLKAARDAGENVNAAVALCREFGTALPLPGCDTAERFTALAALSAVNLTVARIFEAHTDALAILAEAGESAEPDTAWGVFAAEAPDARLGAEVGADGRTATLSGTKPWCSVAAHLDAALVTAHVPSDRQLFRVNLRQATVTPAPAERWVARGLRTVTSAPVHFADTPAVPVGPPGWYLTRPGFARGGIGVAACWHGGATALADTLRTKAAGSDSELRYLHAGAADAALHGSAAALSEAARAIDSGELTREDEELLALQVRSVVVDAVERVLQHSAHALGPAPLAFDADHAARVADLELYVRQHHAERDLAQLGCMLTRKQ